MTTTIIVAGSPGVATTSDDLGNVLICSICGDVADGQHFGADSCRACAAFFRRTISRKLKYICRFDGDCEIAKSYRSLCRACRLNKCIDCGMNARAVRSECVDIVRPPKAGRKCSPELFQEKFIKRPPSIAAPSLAGPIQVPPLVCSPPDITQSNYVWNGLNKRSDSVCSAPHGSVDGDSPYSSASSTTATWPQTSPTASVLSNGEDRQRRNSFIHEIVEINAEEYFVDASVLPPSHPMLMRMLIAYEGLQRRRDQKFNRARDCGGITSRVYTRKDTFDVHRFFMMTQVEIEHIAEMLQTFDGYRDIPHEDKVEIFKHYWIHFVILERNFDTLRVLNSSMDDQRLVFANGDIIDVLNCSYDITQVTDAPLEDVRHMCHPWYRMSAQELIGPVRKLGPTDIEMMFCLGLMLWHFSADLSSKLSPATVQWSERMVDELYNELSSYYKHAVSVDNSVRRVAELMRLISLTERIVMHRKEDIVLARTFRTFKIDVYMDEIFENM